MTYKYGVVAIMMSTCKTVFFYAQCNFVDFSVYESSYICLQEDTGHGKFSFQLYTITHFTCAMLGEKGKKTKIFLERK